MTTSTTRRVMAALLVLGALAWVPLNKPVEGPTLLVLTHNHGITAADLLSVAAVLLALVLLVPGRSEQHRDQRAWPQPMPPRSAPTPPAPYPPRPAPATGPYPPRPLPADRGPGRPPQQPPPPWARPGPPPPFPHRAPGPGAPGRPPASRDDPTVGPMPTRPVHRP